jgi:hypothetical protein
MASHPRGASGQGIRVLRTSAARRIVRLTFLAMGVVVLAVVGALIALRVPGAARHDVPEPPRTNVATAAPDTRRSFVIPPPADAVAQADTSSPKEPAQRPRAVPRPPPAPAAEPPAKDDVPFTINDSKEPSGVQLFPPMGTKPIKRGIIVPDDFELPTGYVRHFQSTDNGERLPAILMFSPDYEWVDAAGRPLTIPPDRVVPPELAPPGLPIQILEPPASKAPPDERR